MPDNSELKPGEPHPIALDALDWIRKNYNLQDIFILIESTASVSIEGNRLAEIACGTLNRLIKGEPVSDRYLLGLAWMLRNMKEDEKENKKY